MSALLPAANAALPAHSRPQARLPPPAHESPALPRSITHRDPRSGAASQTQGLSDAQCWALRASGVPRAPPRPRARTELRRRRSRATCPLIARPGFCSTASWAWCRAPTTRSSCRRSSGEHGGASGLTTRAPPSPACRSARRRERLASARHASSPCRWALAELNVTLNAYQHCFQEQKLLESHSFTRCPKGEAFEKVGGGDARGCHHAALICTGEGRGVALGK